MTKALLLGGALLLAAAPLCAETYKWVDEKGVTNYSSTPPPAKATHAKVIEDRISIIPTDPSFAEASAALRAREARRAQYAHAEWLQRQAAMPYSQAQAYAGFDDCQYCSDYYPYGYASYFPGYFVARNFRNGHRGFAPLRPTRPVPTPHRGIAMTRTRGSPLR